ncbi:MAG: hypothetical protein AB1390_03355 [Nitrospirota bacterium]
MAEHDYLNLHDFLRRLREKEPDRLNPEMTVFIFLIDEILSMAYDTYKETIKSFENGITLDDYYLLMERKCIFTRTYHRDLLKKLFQSGVLY